MGQIDLHPRGEQADAMMIMRCRYMSKNQKSDIAINWSNLRKRCNIDSKGKRACQSYVLPFWQGGRTGYSCQECVNNIELCSSPAEWSFVFV